MSDLAYFKDLWKEVQTLRKRISELEHDDTAMQTLALRDGIATPTTAAAIGQIYVDSGGTVRIRFSDGTVREFTTTAIVLGTESLDFSVDTNSMYLGLV